MHTLAPKTLKKWIIGTLVCPTAISKVFSIKWLSSKLQSADWHNFSWNFVNILNEAWSMELYNKNMHTIGIKL